MFMSKAVSIARRFQRSINIVSDQNDPKALEGFVCPKSSSDALLTLCRNISGTGQAAFTWTGPYGSGKSSLALILSSVLGEDGPLRGRAASVLGKSISSEIWEHLPPGTLGWRLLPVIGSRQDPCKTVALAFSQQEYGNRFDAGRIDDSDYLIGSLLKEGTRNSKAGGGLIVFIDEMGKFLEGAAQHNSDIYFFQQLAEAASRSNGRLIVVGVLHQSFGEYARRLSREMRDEWTKIQGRFVDITINAANEEQLNLISRAISTKHTPSFYERLTETIASEVQKNKRGKSKHIVEALAGCWPLHPITATLLGPLSRRRFGQNQRSLFGFLASSEPGGFQDFLNHTDASSESLFTPDLLWDYLRANLEASILASSDSHRWSIAAEAINRTEASGGTDTHLRLVKTIAILDFLKEHSGVYATKSSLHNALYDLRAQKVDGALRDLTKWSSVLFRKHLNAYGVFAGSDFDIEGALTKVLSEQVEFDLTLLKSLADLHPILAKRHYHETGAMRFYEIDMTPANRAVDIIEDYKPKLGADGLFLLLLPTDGETNDKLNDLCHQVVGIRSDIDVVSGYPQWSRSIVQRGQELIALNEVRISTPELAGDAVARREVEGRISYVVTNLEEDLQSAFDTADWVLPDGEQRSLGLRAINSLASELADKRYPTSPKVFNELLNRIKPSSNAVAAQKILLKAMVQHTDEPRLGIEGYPAEGGLYESLLAVSGLHAETKGQMSFVQPGRVSADMANVLPAWNDAREFLKENNNRAVNLGEIYERWQTKPFGIKDGILPIFAVAFLLAERSKIAFYREGLFQSHLTSLDIDYLTKDPNDIQLRWMELSDISREILTLMAELVSDLDDSQELINLEPIDVARSLIAIFDKIPQWTLRTMRLSDNARRMRDLFRKAHDPNQFLFDDIPSLFATDIDKIDMDAVPTIVAKVKDGLGELSSAFPNLITRLRDQMLQELQVPSNSKSALSELHKRAENVRGVSGDLRLDAFIGRLAVFDGSDKEMEGVANLATNKPSNLWTDRDIDKAALGIVDFSQQFNKLETLARIKGRKANREAMAIIVGNDGQAHPVFSEFNVNQTQREQANKVATLLEKEISKQAVADPNVVLAAIATLATKFIGPQDIEGDD